jgi:general transcription factor 3C polypeptide 3 (transcription factor C subunit 4)
VHATTSSVLQAFEVLPDDPVVNLCIAVGYLMHSISRLVGDRNSCILKAFAFFTRYGARCAHPAEAAFNLGRAFHQLEMNSLAVEWYERCLVLSVADAGGTSMKQEGSDLRFECGHNLALIYESSGARELALRIRWHHCSV